MAQSEQAWQSNTVEYTVHKIPMGDVEDPDLFVASPIYDWQQTPAGKYVMKNSNPAPMWHRTVKDFGYTYSITAYFTPHQLTFYKLKFE